MREYKFDAEKTKDEVVTWIRQFFDENGPGCNAVLGISGGKGQLHSGSPMRRGAW